MVLPAQLSTALGVDVEVAAGLLLVALLIPGLGKDAGQRALHLLVELAVERFAALDHIVVVLEHQLTLHGEIVGHERELIVLSHLLKERNGLVELLENVVDIAFIIGAGDGVLGIRTGKYLGKAFFCPLISSRKIS